MPKAYFEPEHLDALVEVFREAKQNLRRRGITDAVTLDWIARRILSRAGQGLAPRAILAEIIPPVTPEAAGLPSFRGGEKILVHALMGEGGSKFKMAN